MANECKKIVLLKGLEPIDTYYFTMVKSLLASELKMTRKMQEEYDKIKIADLMEQEFPDDAGLGKLIDIFKEIPELKKNTESLRKERLKASASSAMSYFLPPVVSASTPSKASTTEVQKTQAKSQGVDRRSVFCKDPLTVMVLKATDSFEYESSEGQKIKMFHALVATQTTFYHVKVFDINLIGRFTKKKVIIISNYFDCAGILEIKESSSVSEAAPYQMIVVPDKVIKRANETPKIDQLHKSASGAIVYGLFMLTKKTVNKKNTIYEIRDNTGGIEVIGNGKWHNVSCEEGDKLRLFCFQLRRVHKQMTLVSRAPKSRKAPASADEILDDEWEDYTTRTIRSSLIWRE
ncbi:myeloid cell nuclear differentiation antigen-like [Ctenodactylus gundi]